MSSPQFAAMPPRPPMKTCPLCGLAMLASKSDPASATFDEFRCLQCKTEMLLATPAPDRN